MKGTRSAVHRRINITLPEDTVRLIDRVASKGDRSRLIAQAIRYYVQDTGRRELRKRLREGAVRRADRDLELAREWFLVGEETWPRRGR